MDSSGNIYVADTYNQRIQKFDRNGTFLTKWGSYGTNDGQFIYPRGVAVDSSNNVYVADSENSCIQKFNGSGTLLAKWTTGASPNDVAVDNSGQVYVTEGNLVQVFSYNLLTIQFTNPDTIKVSWPSASTLNLQMSTNLATANWFTPAESVTNDGTNKYILVNLRAGNSFYRLKSP